MALIQGVVVFIITFFVGFRPDISALLVAFVFMFLLSFILNRAAGTHYDLSNIKLI